MTTTTTTRIALQNLTSGKDVLTTAELRQVNGGLVRRPLPPCKRFGTTIGMFTVFSLGGIVPGLLFPKRVCIRR